MTKNNLSDIKKPIEKELEEFDKFFGNALKSKVGLVDLIAKYILKQKGKKIRPLLVLLSARTCGQINERSFRGATLVELLHTATLVHDDVVDSADKRRGFPSINAIWKNKISVLMGDYLLARGLMIAVEGDDFDFLKVVTDTVKRMSEGELLQISKTRKLNIDEETYFRIISDKTASLLSSCCEIGAASATSETDGIEAFRNFGHNLGMAFQIRDDILDFVGSSKLFGKSTGRDIKEKKITLPLIYALSKSDKSRKSLILKYIKDGEKNRHITDVIEFVKEQGGISYAENVSVSFAKKAIESISLFPDTDSKRALMNLVDFVIERKN